MTALYWIDWNFEGLVFYVSANQQQVELSAPLANLNQVTTLSSKPHATKRALRFEKMAVIAKREILYDLET